MGACSLFLLVSVNAKSLFLRFLRGVKSPFFHTTKASMGSFLDCLLCPSGWGCSSCSGFVHPFCSPVVFVAVVPSPTHIRDSGPAPLTAGPWGGHRWSLLSERQTGLEKTSKNVKNADTRPQRKRGVCRNPMGVSRVQARAHCPSFLLYFQSKGAKKPLTQAFGACLPHLSGACTTHLASHLTPG